MKRLSARTLSFGFTLLSSLAPITAHAQGFSWNTVSARAAGYGGIYVPSATAPLDAMSTNPAGLAELKRRVVEAGAAGVFGNFAVDGAYSFVHSATSRTGQSKLLAGEYSNSSVRVGTQMLTVTTVWVF